MLAAKDFVAKIIAIIVYYAWDFNTLHDSDVSD
jgi:hypothetical protein